MAKKKPVLAHEISFGRVNLTAVAVFAKHLAVMMRAGVPINEALIIAAESASGKLKKILMKINESVLSGRNLADSLSDYPRIFSGLFVNIIRAGEKSGTLDENLENLSEQLIKQKELRARIKGAMVYPMVVLGASLIVGLTMAFLVLPKITSLFEGLNVELPATTRALIWFSVQIENYGLYIIGALIVVVFFFLWFVRRKFSRPFTHWLLLNIPIIKQISRSSNLAHFCGSLGILLRSGLTIDEALKISADTVSNFYYKRDLRSAHKEVIKGTKLWENLSAYESRFPRVVTRMVRVGEESGKLEETLLYLADFYEAEVDTATKALTTAIEPILLLLIGLLVTFIALSIITPIYDVTGNIGRGRN